MFCYRRPPPPPIHARFRPTTVSWLTGARASFTCQWKKGEGSVKGNWHPLETNIGLFLPFSFVLYCSWQFLNLPFTPVSFSLSFLTAAVTPSRKSPSRRSHVRQFSQNWMGRGYLVAVTGLRGCYGISIAVTGSMSHSFFVKIRLAWLLQEKFICKRVWPYGTAKKKRPGYLVGNLVATNWPIEKALHAIGY